MNSTRAKLLLVDADRALTRAIVAALSDAGREITVAESAGEAATILSVEPIQILVVEPHAIPSPFDAWLRDVRHQHRATIPIVLTAHGNIPAAVGAMRAGAFDYLVKPVTFERLRDAIERALRHQRLIDEPSSSTADRNDPFSIPGDGKMRQLLDTAITVADSRATVLITGETGTGKSRLARMIHARSPRRDRPFVEVACGSLSEPLLASELFGHVKGAFTSAMADMPGRFAAADGGTIFLDEINAAPLSMQVQLLRVLQERMFEPVGSSQTRSVDARTILATNADLPSLVASGEFREDLFHRVNVVSLHLPPLRERVGEIEPLAALFVERFRREHGRQTLGLTDEAIDAMRRYPWPGNVRELEHAVERAVLLGRRPVIEVDDLPPAIAQLEPLAITPTASFASVSPATTLEAALEHTEREIIEAALLRNGWSRQESARELGIDRTTLYKKMRKHGLGGDRASAA